MGMGVVPRINERSALAIGVVAPFFLLETFRFSKRDVLAYDFGGRIIGGDFLPLMVGRTLAFR